MRLGLLSDTHGHLERTRAALTVLTDQHVDQLIHCGDIGSDLVLDLLFEQHETGTPVTLVPGNVDEWSPDIILYARTLGFPCHQVARLNVESHNIAVYHGHDPKQMQTLLSESALNYIFTGHTHVARDEVVNGIRVINPGAVYRATVPSVAVLDLDEDHKLEFLEL